MSQRALYVSFLVMISFLAGCGGGGGTSPAVPVPPPAVTPSFTIATSADSLSIPQGSSQAVTVNVAGKNGFASTVTVTSSALPSGITIAPTALNIAANSSGSFVLTAAANASSSSTSVIFTGVSGSSQATVAINLIVLGSPRVDPYHLVGGGPQHGFYDEPRKLLFATNNLLNEVDVISGIDYSVVARIPVPQPWGIDQMADGKTLVIGTKVQQILTLDEDTYALVSHPLNGPGIMFSGVPGSVYGPPGIVAPIVTAMGNGKVLIIAQEQGTESADIGDGGQKVFIWDSSTDTFSVFPLNPSFPGDITRLSRSADHKWAVFAADQFYLYNSDADNYTTTSLVAVNPPSGIFGIRGYAVNSDGTLIAVVSAKQVTLLDRSFTVLRTIEIPGAFQTARTEVRFSPDGTKLLLQYSLPIGLEVIDLSTSSALGYFSGYVTPDDPQNARLLGVDSAAHAFLSENSGFQVVDMNGPMATNSDASSLPGAYCSIPTVSYAPLNTAVAVSAASIPVPANYFAGGLPVPFNVNALQLDFPASSVSGPVNIQCIDANNRTELELFAFSYGVKVHSISANLLPPSGNPKVYLIASGLKSASGSVPAISIGGTAASNVAAQPTTFGGVQIAALNIPPGTPGKASVSVTTPNGTDTLTGATSYISSTTLIPDSGIVQLTYDAHRNLLYALKATEVEVFDGISLQPKPSISLPAVATGSGPYNEMALSPDGSKLVVLAINGPNSAGSGVIIDPDHTTSQVGFALTLSGSIAITKDNKAVLTGSQNVLLDLNTLAVTPITAEIGSIVRSSADGTHVYGVKTNISSADIFSLDLATLASSVNRFGFMYWSDLAVSPDGSGFVGIRSDPNFTGYVIAPIDPALHLLNLNVYPESSEPIAPPSTGTTYSPGGKVIVAPLTDSIEFWDAKFATLNGRLATPEPLALGQGTTTMVAPSIALDSTGQTIFAISKSGITVMKLPDVVDSMAKYDWPFLRAMPFGTNGANSAKIKKIQANTTKAN